MLTHTYSPLGRYLLTHKSDQSLTLDGNFHLWAQDLLSLSLYANSVLKQDKKQWNNKLHLRFHHDDNKVVSVGVEDWDVLSQQAPQTLSAWGICGFKVDQWRPFVGISGGFGLQSKKISYHKYLAGLKQKDWSLYAAFNSKRVTKDGKDSWANDCSFIADQKVNKDIKVSADIKCTCDDTCKPVVALVGEYRLDNDTFFKAKASNSDNSLTLSLTKNYRQLINFCFVTKV
jgi:hypothetical protein